MPIRSGESVLVCRDVAKSYRRAQAQVRALQGVDLTIGEPGFYAVMGASGSGKSTLLHLLCCLDRPDRGEIELDGRRIDRFSESQATAFRRRGVGIVFQQFNLIPTLTARQNVELPGVLAGESAAFLRGRSGELLDRLGLTGRDDHRPDALSGGEQQRVAIARALLFSPPLLLADEPTGNLDSESSERLWSLLAEVAAGDQLMVVMVTHEPAAAAHCRRAFVLKDGRVTATLETEGLDAAGVAAGYQHCLHAA
ncbi:MAG: ABC transporter ATP-binding protein [Phycisphaerae bacterium]|nr:ABC transporter ATP-binding protein [Phycisphaerae bacterium]